MFWRSKLNIALVVLPLLLLVPLFYVKSRRPRPLLGVNGPAYLLQRPETIAYAPDGTIFCASAGDILSYKPDKRQWYPVTSESGIAGFTSGNIPETATQQLKFSRDGKILYAAQSNITSGFIQAFDVQSLKFRYCFGSPLAAVYDVSPDGKWAAFRRIGSMVLLDLSASPLPRKGDTSQSSFTDSKTPDSYRDYPARHYVLGDNPQSLRFSPDSKKLAVAYNHEVVVFDIQSDLIKRASKPTGPKSQESPVLTEPSHSYDVGSPRQVEWSPDGTKLAVYAAKSLTLLDSKLGKIASTSIFGQSNANADILWMKDSQSFYTDGAQVSRWRLTDTATSGEQSLVEEFKYEEIGPIALSPDEKTLLTCSPPKEREPSIWQWNVR